MIFSSKTLAGILLIDMGALLMYNVSGMCVTGAVQGLVRGLSGTCITGAVQRVGLSLLGMCVSQVRLGLRAYFVRHVCITGAVRGLGLTL